MKVSAAARTFKSIKDIPSPKQIPFLGHAHILLSKRFTKRGIEVINELQEQHGNIYKLNVPGKGPMVVVLKPEDVCTVFKNDAKYPYKPGFDSFAWYRKSRPDLYKNYIGLLGERGEKWYDIRSRVQQDMMRPKSAYHYLDPLQEISSDFIQLLDENKDGKGELPDHTLNLLHRWSLESISRIFLDVRVGALEKDAMKEGTFTEIMINQSGVFIKNLVRIAFGVPYFKVWPRAFAWFREMDQAGEMTFNAAKEKVKKSIADIVAKNEMLKQKGEKPSGEIGILEKLVAKHGSDSEFPTIMTMDGLAAGIDTTAHSVAFFMYTLATNPEKQELLYQEIDRVIGNEPITESHLNKMRYLKAATMESLRCISTTFTISRILEVPVTLSGYEIPAGTFILLPSMHISKQDSNFPDADKFIPERFLRGHEMESKASAFAHLPFGHGARMCIGRRFATLEIYIVIIKLLQKYRLEWHYPKDLTPIVHIVNKPSRPLNIRLVQRK